MSQELSNFKKVLEYFVEHLQLLVAYDKDENPSKEWLPESKYGFIHKTMTGKGYKGEDIQNQIKEWSVFDEREICINVQHHQKNGYKAACNYLNWDKTFISIYAKWEGDKIENLEIRSNKKIYIDNKSVKDLGLFNDAAPTKALEDFWDSFKNCKIDDSYNDQNKSTNNKKNAKEDENNMEEQLPHNLILYGPPGTGKTYSTIEYALKILLENTKLKELTRTVQKKIFDELKKKGRIVFTTFHQSMSYEDFVQGIKPKTDENGNIVYKVEKGIFRQICETAETAQKCKTTVEGIEYSITNNCVLIIDEINRGNVSEIFGELITLIETDKRIGEKNEIRVKLPTSDGSDKAFGVPANVYIIGTMNTADRSVEALDTALRRRFSFVEMMPKYDLPELNKKIAGIELKTILQTINERIIWLKGREQQIGHSYFLECKNNNDFLNIFKNKIVPLLQEYFYGDYYQIGLVIGDSFVRKENKCEFAKGFADNSDRDDLYRLLTDEDWEKLNMEIAINNLINLNDSKNSTQSGEEASIDN